MKQFLCTQLLVCLGWLSCIALAQLEISDAITGSASFPHVGITSLANLAVFITCILKKRFHLEMGARDFLVINASPLKFEEEYGNQLAEKKKVTCTRKLAKLISSFLRRLFDLEMSTSGLMASRKELIAAVPKNPQEASVIMLSNSAGMTNSSLRQFMDYIYNVHDVRSVLLKYDILEDTKVHCKCGSERHGCNCIVISKVKRINMSQVPKELPESLVLLPSLQCRENECHGCNPHLLHVEEVENECHGCNPHLLHVEEVEDNLNVEFSSAVSDALDFAFTTPAEKEPICICIPVNDDKWTKLLIRFLKYKDPADNTDLATSAQILQSYLDNRGEDRAETRAEDRVEEVIYKKFPLIVIRFVEIFVNLLLTVFFKVDGFSSSLAARRVVRSYVVDEKGKGLSVNSFLTSGLVVVKSDSVCQVLKFRGNRTFLLIVGCVNLLCSIAWAVVLIAFNGGIGKWYAVPSMAPSIPRVAVIIAAICIGIGMDCFEYFKFSGNYGEPFWKEICNQFSNSGENKKSWKEIIKKRRRALMIWGVIILEILFVVVVAVAQGLNKGIGRWVYGSLQLLVWFKWGIGSCLVGAYSPEYVPTTPERHWNGNYRAVLMYSSAKWVDQGSLVYCSSFFLNAVMVGVMGDWAGIWST